MSISSVLFKTKGFNLYITLSDQVNKKKGKKEKKKLCCVLPLEWRSHTLLCGSLIMDDLSESPLATREQHEGCSLCAKVALQKQIEVHLFITIFHYSALINALRI